MQIFTEITNLASDVGALEPTFPSIRHVQAIAHGCACSHCKMGLKMEDEDCHIFLFWHRTMISTVSSHADKSPTCDETFKNMPHLPKSKVIEELNPKNGHFNNKVLIIMSYSCFLRTWQILFKVG